VHKNHILTIFQKFDLEYRIWIPCRWMAIDGKYQHYE
jgi:hypothetical protein